MLFVVYARMLRAGTARVGRYICHMVAIYMPQGSQPVLADAFVPDLVDLYLLSSVSVSVTDKIDPSRSKAPPPTNQVGETYTRRSMSSSGCRRRNKTYTEVPSA